MVVKTHVLVANIPTSDNGGAIVDGQRLVVHAMIQLLEVRCEIPASAECVPVVTAIEEP